MQTFVVIYLAVINITAYFFMWLDKRRAIRQQWRIPERTLFLLSLCGGFIGMGLAMKHFRHKTQHLSFKLVFVVSVGLWIAMFYWIKSSLLV